MRSADARARVSPLGVPRRGTDEQARSDATRRGRRGYFARRARSDATRRGRRGYFARRARSDVLRPAPPMRTKVNRLNRFPASLAWCMSLSYSQCRAAVDGFVARLHSIIHPAGCNLRDALVVPGTGRTHPRTGHSSVSGLDCGHRLGSASCSWNRLPGFPPEFAAYVVALIAGSSFSHRPDAARRAKEPRRRGAGRPNESSA